MIKVQKVHIDRFKVLENLEADLKGKNVLLIGDNGLGKSSFMQFIKIALGEQKHLPPDTEGEGFVIVTKDGDQYTFKVDISLGKSKVIIEGPDGLKDNRKGTLAQLVGAMDFDVNEFVELSRSKGGQKKQVELYRAFLPDDIKKELTRMETNVKVAFDDRTQLSRDITTTEGFIKDHPLGPLAYANRLDEFKGVDVDSVLAKQKTAQAHNDLVEKAIAKKENNDKELIRINASIDKAEKELQEMKAAIVKKEKEINEIKDNHILAQAACNKTDTWLASNSKVDTAEFDTAIKNATEANKRYQDAQELKKKMGLLEKMKADHENATVNIESQREEIAKFIRTETPVDGLEFDEEKLIYKGRSVHPDSMATSEIIELGIKMKMAENPELGVLFIEHGESLGKDKFQALMDISKSYGWQLLIEQVERGTDTLKIELISEETKEK